VEEERNSYFACYTSVLKAETRRVGKCHSDFNEVWAEIYFKKAGKAIFWLDLSVS
jgi:hypothetical protein